MTMTIVALLRISVWVTGTVCVWDAVAKNLTKTLLQNVSFVGMHHSASDEIVWE